MPLDCVHLVQTKLITMYPMLKHLHSGWRWIVLALLLAAIINAIMKWQSGKSFSESDRKLGLFAMISTHIQFIFGLIIYFMSPLVNFDEGFMKNAVTRFFAVEHLTMMLIAIVLITIGYSRSKRQTDGTKKFKTQAIFYLIALAIMLYAIPWPGGSIGGSWG